MNSLLLLSSTIVLLVIGGIYFIRKLFKKNDLLLPDLSISIESKSDSLCAVKLVNKGKGTAVIKDVNFWNSTLNGNKKNSIDEVFQIKKSYWINSTDMCCDNNFFLASGDSLYFGKLKKEHVLLNGGNFNHTKKVFDEQVKDMKIKIEYSDVFSHKLSPFLFNN